MARKTKDTSGFTFIPAFQSDLELNQYKPNDLTIFALALYLKLDDIQEFAANAITEGGDDKKIDILYFDPNDNRVIIAQSYFSPTTWGKVNAPEKKASDLNTAIAWLLSTNIERVPFRLKPKAIELRDALKNGEVDRLEILYIHNCFEGTNVANELSAVAAHARDTIRVLNSDIESQPIISFDEFGLTRIEELYKSRDKEILVEGWLNIPVSDSGYVPEIGDDWKAILTTVSGKWIQDLYKQHKNLLFSANYRDFLGSKRQKGKINWRITDTAGSEPNNFWVYNNGITALTNKLELGPPIRIDGISIINGAQTTGALSTVDEASIEKIKVPLRIVECTKRELIDKIIQYNNTQNAIIAADKRSNDEIQMRLQTDFSNFRITYVHRRSDTSIPRDAITSISVAPSLCAFHGDPQTAYRNATEIFIDDDIYKKYFPISISVEHVFLVRRLAISIDKIKTELKEKVSRKTATKQEQLQNNLLRYTASKHFLMFIVGTLAEEIMGTGVSDIFEWKCKPNVVTPEGTSLTEAWNTALRALLPHITHAVEQRGTNPFYDIPRSAEQSKQVATDLRPLIASLGPLLGSQFDDVRQKTTV